MKKKLTALFAVALAVTMALSTFASAGVSDISKDITATGTTNVINPVYSVTLPTTVALTLDPLEIKESGSVFSDDFFIVNRSSAPVRITANIFSAKGSAVTMVDTAAAVTNAPNTKQAFVYLEFAKALSVGVADKPTTGDPAVPAVINNTAVTPDNVGKVWSYENADTSRSVIKNTQIAAASGTKVMFILDKWPYTDATPPVMDTAPVDPMPNAAGFKFSGKITEIPQTTAGVLSPWVAADIKPSVVFTIVGLSTTTYGNRATDYNAFGTGATNVFVTK